MTWTTLDRDYQWRKITYHSGYCDIPEDLFSAIGGVSTPEPEPAPEPAPEPEPPALELINTATVASALTVLPGIGNAGAAVLLGNRPVDGYVDFAQLTDLNGELTVGSFNVSWSAIADWQP